MKKPLRLVPPGPAAKVSSVIAKTQRALRGRESEAVLAIGVVMLRADGMIHQLHASVSDHQASTLIGGFERIKHRILAGEDF